MDDSEAARPAGERPGILLIGVGNQERCDDGVGLVVARTLAAKNLLDLTAVEARGDGAWLMEMWKGAQHVILVDAVCSGAEAGTVHRLEANEDSIPPAIFRCSSHDFGVGEAIELSRALFQLPPRLTVFGIEGKNFQAGIGLSREIVTAARRVVAAIAQEARAGRPARPRRPRARRRIAGDLTARGE